MKHAIIGDIHGRYDLLLNVISRLQYNGFELGRDTLVCLGDYIDRGKQSKQVIQYLTILKKDYGDKVVLLKGNHEQLAEDFLLCSYNERKEIAKWWLVNGGRETLNSFKETIDDTLIPFIKSLQITYETSNFVCVHGGIPIGKNIYTATEDELLWNRKNNHYRGKLQIVGHSIVKRVHQLEDTLYIDTGAFTYGKLSAVIMPDMKSVTTNGGVK